MKKLLKTKNNTIAVVMMDQEFDVKKMDIRWLVETAEREIDTSDLNNYVEGVLSELDNMVDILPKWDMCDDKEKISKNLYQLTQSLVHNSQTFLLAEKLPELYNTLEKMSPFIAEDDNISFSVLLDFLNSVINYDTLSTDKLLGTVQKDYLYKSVIEQFSNAEDHFIDDDQYIHIMAKNYQGLIKRNLCEIESIIGDKAVDRDIFEECRALALENLDIEQLIEKVESIDENERKDQITEDEYHALELLGHIDFNLARLENDYSMHEHILMRAVKDRELALSACPEYLNDTTARYELMYAYATLAEDMIKKDPENNLDYLLEIYNKMHGLKNDMLTVSPYLSEKIEFVYSVTELYDKKIGD